jgi:hypothetical protein
MNWPHIRATLKGALKSFTVWAAGIVAVLPDGLTLIQNNFATVAPFIPKEKQEWTLRGIALVMLLLRLKTTTSLAEKGASKADLNIPSGDAQ